MTSMSSMEDLVVSIIHSQFNALPKKSKPREINEKNVAEWIPLSGIAVCRGTKTFSF